MDSDPDMRRTSSARLVAANYSVETAASAPAALDACVRSRPNLVITDLRLEQMDGLALLKELKGRWPNMTVIILTAFGTISEAVQATQLGAFGFLVQPVDKSELLGQVQRAIANSTFTQVEGDWRANIVSRSSLMEERLGQANWAARSDVPVLLIGENGTGKELLARAIHAASERREQPFVSVNCRSVAGEALASELFGQEAAGEKQSGALNAARGGTLLLEEIGDLSIALQDKLLAALRSDHNLRLVCTTSSDLKQMTDAATFRQHLYYKINILPIEVPPLGRRREDIPLLVSHFLQQATKQNGLEKIYTPKAIELLATTDWPGNVRQLFDLVKQNIALAQGSVMTEEFVQNSLSSDAVRAPAFDEARDKFTHDYLANNLQETGGNISKSARLAKRNRTDFYKLLARYRIQAHKFKNAQEKP
ncbi:MAG TPA: sigma 54-interacting transcriptional regulator [Steroidobacteraceae bacterium]